MKKYWFKPKSYGYGFYPISWEGWVSTFIFILVLLGLSYVNDFFNPEIGLPNGFNFLFGVIVISLIFTTLFKDKVRGGLQWKWGDDKK